MGTLQYIAAIPPEAKTHNRLYIDLKCENVSTQMELGLFVWHFKCGRRVKDGAELPRSSSKQFLAPFLSSKKSSCLECIYLPENIISFVSGCFDKNNVYFKRVLMIKV